MASRPSAEDRVELGPTELEFVDERGLRDRVGEVVRGSGYTEVELADSPLRRA